MVQSLHSSAMVATLLKEVPKPIILIGAGASVTSGIPLAGEIVSKAAKWAYARQSGKNADDPRITRSDWYPWLVETQSWFDQSKPIASLFPYAVEHLLQPKKIRKDFWIKILNPDTPIGIGYLRLVELMHLQKISTVLTTNFDDCISKARNEINRPHHIDIVKTPSDLIKISATPTYPLLVYLRGAVENYTDKNVIEEIEKMDDRLVSSLIPLLKDHPLIVIGYRGTESSIMNHLLIQNAAKAENYKNGIYWCIRKGEMIDDVSDFIKLLDKTISPNLQFVEIESFDHLFDKVIWPHIGKEKLKIDTSRTIIPVQINLETTILTFDLKNAKKLGTDDFEESLLKIRISKYCSKLNVSIPDLISNDWLQQQMQILNLIRKENSGETFATNAGILLFSRLPQSIISNAKVIIRFIGNDAWLKKVLGDEFSEGNKVERIVEGNLWAQLNEISNALSLINRPFRLKDEKSENVLPYDPIALKEVIVNSLVHRDYEIDQPNVIEIYHDKIFIKNPGGLIEEVKAFFEDELMQHEITKGRRGIKGYRNPALADLFYSSGDMDKKGSGLYDVVNRVRQNAGYVEFSPSPSNNEFSVALWCRPEAIDEVTNTATSLNVVTTKFYSNIVEFQQVPNTIYFAPSLHKTVLDMFESFEDVTFPPFLFSEKNIYSFSDLRSPKNPLNLLIDKGGIGTYALDEFLELPEGDKKFIRMLNDYLKSHMYDLGLIVDHDKKRAYYPKTENGERVISYKARFKKATRTLVRPRYAQDKVRIRYWEHKAFYYTVKRFGNQWGLFIEPTYVFTLNGEKIPLASQRVGALATKKASRDYNINVLNDIIFWIYILANGSTEAFRLSNNIGLHLEDEIILSTEYLSANLNYVENVGDSEIENIQEDEDTELDEEIARIADLEREQQNKDLPTSSNNQISEMQ